MRDNTIDYKVKVFISSLCGSRYTIVRKGLKNLLEETNLATVYIFESTGASSQDVIPSYITKIDDSDLCIFLIDNKDGVSDAVIREQKRVRQLNIKSIYLFCDENQKEETQIQKEIIASLKEKFRVIHEFSDFIMTGYQSTLQDIVDIYRNYCKGYLISKKENEDNIELKYPTADTYTLNKQLYNGFDLTKKSLSNIIYSHDREISETSELDKVCQELLNIIIGKESIKSFDFNLLERELCNIHEEYLINFIKIRINAIKAYYNNNIEECLMFLNSAYEESVSNDSIPNWLANDVLIDMKNTSNLLDETKSQFTIDNKAQSLLKGNKESVYYPVLDRFDAGAYKDILNKSLSSSIESPYTTSFGGLDTIFDKIASAYVISVLFGSLTHILITRERIIDTLSNLCLVYNDHSIYIELIKQLVICQKDKDIEKISRAYNHTTDIINSHDIEKFIIALNSIPISHKRIISKLIIFEHFGYYLSDQQYENISNELIEEIGNWINDNSRIFNLSSYIFKALKANVRRLDNNQILNIVMGIFKRGLKRWYDDALKLIQALDLSSLTNDMLIIELIKQLLELVSHEELRKNCYSLPETIIYVRKNSNIMTEEIDQCVKDNMEQFFNNDYSLEVFSFDSEGSIKHICRYVQIIHNQNEEQGKNGTYHGWGGNPYQTIKNIIKYDKPELSWDNMELIISTIEETVYSKKQTITAKVDAIQLLIFLKNNTIYKKELYQIFKKCLELQAEILCGYEDGFFNKDTIQTLKFNMLMLKVCFGEQSDNDLLSFLSTFSQQNNYEIIKSLECIEVLLYNIDFDLLDINTLTILSQYVIGMSSHKETDARYYSVRILFLLIKSSYSESAMMQLSRMMDNDNYIIKANILNRIDVLQEINIEISELIKQKGKADNNYLVRKLAGKQIVK